MPRKYRILAQNSNVTHSQSDDEGNSHLPQLSSNTSRRFRQPRKEYLTSISLTRFNRPPLTHLPPLPATTLNEEDQKQKSDLRRRQVRVVLIS